MVVVVLADIVVIVQTVKLFYTDICYCVFDCCKVLHPL